MPSHWQPPASQQPANGQYPPPPSHVSIMVLLHCSAASSRLFAAPVQVTRARSLSSPVSKCATPLGPSCPTSFLP